MTPESPFAVPTIATIPANTSSAEARSTLARLHDLAQEQENFQSRLAALREERDSLILRGLAHGLSSSELAATSHLTGARVRAIADTAASFLRARARVPGHRQARGAQARGLHHLRGPRRSFFQSRKATPASSFSART